jgi:hypothetical protein
MNEDNVDQYQKNFQTLLHHLGYTTQLHLKQVSCFLLFTFSGNDCVLLQYSRFFLPHQQHFSVPVVMNQEH